MITVGIPIYNAAAYLSDSIKSVLMQTFQDFELILVDDGSSDNSLKIAREFAAKDDRIRIIADGENKKLPARLNQIVREAKYDFIARMDADDLMDPNRLARQFEVIQKSNIDLVTTGMYSIGKNNEIQGKRILPNYQMSAEEILYGLTNLLHASLLAKKNWCLRNLYQEDNLLAEDYELWLSAAVKNDLNYVVIEEPLYYYREVENVRVDKMVKGYNAQINVINKYYAGVISEHERKKIISRFERKKIIVKFFHILNLMNVLRRRRVVKVTKSDEKDFLKKLDMIKCGPYNVR